jgi:4'-phosphopantetheinyl transferase
MTFPTNRVDIWKVCLDKPAKAGFEMKVLSPDEIARGAQFHSEKDRLHFIRCRSALRGVLAGYIAIPATEIRFEYLSSGKPQLEASHNPRAIEFNVSHSAGMALIAVSGEHRLGVDVERIREDVATAALADRFFSPREREGLRALPAQVRVRGFFACWTRKEAFLKATGDGLTFPLADFSVTTHPDSDPKLEEIKGNKEAGNQWFLADIDAGNAYRAAVAIEATPCRVETYTWN